jgi:hypothetical protein
MDTNIRMIPAVYLIYIEKFFRFCITVQAEHSSRNHV